MNPNDVEMLRGWIGRSETSREVLSPVPAQCLAATLCLPAHSVPPGTLPPLWHWLHFPDRTPSDRLAEDGSPTGNALRPPVPLSQVMWAGAESTYSGRCAPASTRSGNRRWPTCPSRPARAATWSS